MTRRALAAGTWRAPAVATLAAALGTALCVIAAAWLPEPTRSGDVVLWLAAAFVPYGWLVADGRALPPRLSLGLSAVTVLCLVPVLPPLSDDVYRFVWDGHVLGHGIDPYLYPPEHPALYELRDRWFPHINHPHIRTIYPPVAQALFAALSALWHDPRVMKLAAGVCLLIVGDQLARRGEARGCQLLVLNPLALGESALGGHLDIAVGGAVLLAAYASEAGRGARASLWLAAATGLKMVGLLLAPLASRRLAGAALATGLCALVLVPQLWPRGEGLGGAGHYARRWQGNAGGFLVVEAACAQLLAALASPSDRARHHVRLPALAPLLTRLEGGPLDPWRGVLAEKKSVPDRTDFEISFLAGLLARGVVAALLAGLVVATWLAQVAPRAAARWLLLCLLWLAPQVHPWYLMWVLPLECALGGLAGLLWSALVLAAYAPLELWLAQRVWTESAMIQALEYGIVGLVMACELRLTRRPGQVTLGPSSPQVPTH